MALQGRLVMSIHDVTPSTMDDVRYLLTASDDYLDRAVFELIEFGKTLVKLPAQMLYCERDSFLRLGGFNEELRLAEDRELLVRLMRDGVPVCRLTESQIATSPRRLRLLPWRLGMLTMLIRWALANWGIGRNWPY